MEVYGMSGKSLPTSGDNFLKTKVTKSTFNG